MTTQAPETQLTEPYDTIVCFAPEIVDPGELVVLEMQLSLHFQGTRLVVPSNVGLSFHVHDLLVNGEPQSQSPRNPIPAAAFSERAKGVALGLPMNRPGSTLSLAIANTAPERKIFVAYMEGVEWIGDPASKFEMMVIAGQSYKIDKNPVPTSKVVHRQRLEHA